MKRHKKKIIIASILIILVFMFLYWVNTPYRNSNNLIKAIREENIDKVEKMLEEGINPNVLSASKLESVLLGLVESGPNRPLSEACNIGNLKIIELLIDYGATAEPNEDAGWSPLSETLFFYQKDDIKIVELLLKNGADITYENEYYGIPVFMAAEMVPQDYNRIGTNANLNVEEYSEDAAKGITEITMILLGNQSIDIQNEWGGTLLIIATKQGNIYLVNHLISLGCDTQIRDDFGKTAYDYALESGNSDLISLLE